MIMIGLLCAGNIVQDAGCAAGQPGVANTVPYTSPPPGHAAGHALPAGQQHLGHQLRCVAARDLPGNPRGFWAPILAVAALGQR